MSFSTANGSVMGFLHLVDLCHITVIWNCITTLFTRQVMVCRGVPIRKAVIVTMYTCMHGCMCVGVVVWKIETSYKTKNHLYETVLGTQGVEGFCVLGN